VYELLRYIIGNVSQFPLSLLRNPTPKDGIHLRLDLLGRRFVANEDPCALQNFVAIESDRTRRRLQAHRWGVLVQMIHLIAAMELFSVFFQ